MKNRYLLLRWLLLVAGLFVMATGVSLSVKADLGVTPISCVPYVYSLITPLTIGETTIIMNGIFVLLQMAILRKKYQWIQLSQFVAVIFFGYSIDFTMYLLSGLTPQLYVWKLITMLAGCVFVAMGIFLFVKAELTYIPGDAFLVVIAREFKRDFGKIKVTFDCSMLVIGAASSLFFLHRVAGIREGTVVAAILVGILIGFYGKISNKFFQRLLGREIPAFASSPSTPRSHTPPLVVTISREYGSGGHEIGQLLAKKLNVPFFDKELINITAEKSGFTENYIQANEQKIAGTLFHELYAQNYAYVDQLPPTDTLFLVQSKIIRDISRQGPCVIVGRCANFVLKGDPGCFNVFVHANNEYRKSKIINDYKAKSTFSDKELAQSDHERANYCLKYTGQNWRDCTNYHLTLDSSRFSREQIVKNIMSMIHETMPVLDRTK